MMHLEFTDAEVAHCRWAEGQLQLHFSAAALHDRSDPRSDIVWAPVLLHASGVEPWESLDPAICMGRLRQGMVLHASARHHQLPLPSELQGVITMELEFAQGPVLRVRCTELAVHPVAGTATAAYQC